MSEQQTFRQIRAELLRHRFETQKQEDRRHRAMEKKLKAKHLRSMLVRQMTYGHNLDFIVYYLTEKQIGHGNSDAPIVTIVTAWDKNGEPCDNKYMRGIAICSRRDAPNRLDGFNMAARRLLRADKDGLAPIRLDPDNENLMDIWDALEARGLVFKASIEGKVYTYASSYTPNLTLLETSVLEGRAQRRKDRDARRQERDEIKNGLIAGVVFPSDNH